MFDMLEYALYTKKRVTHITIIINLHFFITVANKFTVDVTLYKI